MTEIVLLGVKPYELHRHHFIDRLKERYGLDISQEEYDELNRKQEFRSMFQKGSGSLIVELFYKGRRIMAIFNKKSQILTTALPEACWTDDDQLIRAMLPGRQWPLALKIKQIILDDVNRGNISDFPTKKEAAMYAYSNLMFPTLFLEKYEFGQVRPEKIACEVRKILDDKHDYATVALVKRNKKGIQ